MINDISRIINAYVKRTYRFGSVFNKFEEFKILSEKINRILLCGHLLVVIFVIGFSFTSIIVETERFCIVRLCFIPYRNLKVESIVKSSNETCHFLRCSEFGYRRMSTLSTINQESCAAQRK